MAIIRATILSLLFAAFFLLSVQAQSVFVTGTIRDIAGKPVTGASVSVQNSRRGTSSDTLGIFRIKVKPGDSIVITAIGFGDTTFVMAGQSLVAVTLVPKPSSLSTAVVSEGGQGQGLPNPEEAVKEQIIQDVLQEYATGAMWSNGQYHYDGLQVVNGRIVMVNTWINGVGPLNTLTSGTMLPEVKHQEDTRGSRYLLKSFTRGVIVDKNWQVLADSSLLLNYDKIDGQLLIAHGAGTYMEVDKEKVAAFGLRAEDSAYVFVNVPVLSKVNYFFMIASGPKYSVYKSVRTKFVKANYENRGLVETGKDYDEYVDKQTYFWVEKGDHAGVLELKKKSIREVFADERVKVDAYFSAHKYDDIDDGFVRNLINYLNKP